MHRPDQAMTRPQQWETSYLNDFGMVPLILLFSRRREVRFGKEPSSGGIVPVSCTHDRSHEQLPHMHCDCSPSMTSLFELMHKHEREGLICKRLQLH